MVAGTSCCIKSCEHLSGCTYLVVSDGGSSDLLCSVLNNISDSIIALVTEEGNGLPFVLQLK